MGFRAALPSVLERHAWGIALIAAIALLIVAPSGANGIINITDFDFPLNPAKNMESHVYTWDPQILDGTERTADTQMAFNFMTAVPAYLGIPVSLIQRAYLLFVLSALGGSMYYLAYTLLRNRNASLAAAVFYMVNPYTLYLLNTGAHMLLLSHATLPAMLAFFIKGMSCNRWGKYAAGIALLSVFTVSHPAYPVLAALLLSAYTPYNLITTRLRRLAENAKFITVCATCVIFINAWWLVPLLSNVASSTTLSPFQPSVKDLEQRTHTLARAALMEPYGVLNPWFYAFGFALLVLVALAAFLGRKSAYMWFFAPVAVISIFLIRGITPPLGEIYQWLYLNVPFFEVFRDGGRFTALLSLSYSALLAIGFDGLQETLRAWAARIWGALRIAIPCPKLCRSINAGAALSAFIVGMTLLYSSSFIVGYLGGYLSPIVIPTEYDKVAKWLSAYEETSRVLVLPQQNWLVKYKWASYDMFDVLRYLSPKPLLTDWPGAANPAIQTYAYLNFGADYTPHIAKLLGLANVKYILLRSDTESLWSNRDMPHPFRDSEEMLALQSGINPAYSLNGSTQPAYGLAITDNFDTLNKSRWRIPKYKDSNLRIENGTLVMERDSSILSTLMLEQGSVSMRLRVAFSKDRDGDVLWGFLQPDSTYREVFVQLHDKHSTSLMRTDFYGTYFENVAERFFSGDWHEYRISLDESGVTYSVDGELIAKIPQTIKNGMQIALSNGGTPPVYVDSISISGTVRDLDKPSEYTFNIYENDFFTPFVNAPRTVILADGDYSLLLPLSYATGFDPRNAAVFFTQQLTPSEINEVRRRADLFVYYGENANRDPLQEIGMPFVRILAVNDSAGYKGFSIAVPYAGSYDISLMVGDDKPVSVLVDGALVSNGSLNSKEWNGIGTIELGAGLHNVSLSGAGNIEYFSIGSVGAWDALDGHSASKPEVTFARLSPVEYSAHVNNSAPFVIVFGEGYNKKWEARANGSVMRPIPVNSFANAYLFDAGGDYDITISFKSQKYLRTGLYISAVSLIALLIALAIILKKESTLPAHEK